MIVEIDMDELIGLLERIAETTDKAAEFIGGGVDATESSDEERAQAKFLKELEGQSKDIDHAIRDLRSARLRAAA